MSTARSIERSAPRYVIRLPQPGSSCSAPAMPPMAVASTLPVASSTSAAAASTGSTSAPRAR